MNKLNAETSQAETLQFDVWLRVPPRADLSAIAEYLTRHLGIDAVKVEQLVNGLKTHQRALVGHHVSEEAAKRAEANFRQAGLEVTLEPVLTLEAINEDDDGSIECPACEERVVLSPQRQCPQCGVYVDKLSPEYLLRKKVAMEERMRLRVVAQKQEEENQRESEAATEQRLRQKLRAELEKEFLLKPKPAFFSGRLGLLKAAGALALLVAVFAGGYLAAIASNPRLDQPSVNEALLVGAAGQAQAGNPMTLKVTAPASNDSMTGNPATSEDVQPSLIQLAKQDQGGAETQTIMQAVAGSLNAPTASAQNKTAGAVTTEAKVSVVAGSSLPAPLKIGLGAELARTLAELGQAPRARDVVTTLYAAAKLSGDNSAAIPVKRADLEIEAWALSQAPDSGVKAQLDTLITHASPIPEAAERAAALAQIGVILAQQPRLSTSASSAFFNAADDAVKLIKEPLIRASVSDDVLVAKARAQLEQLKAMARQGAWNRVAAAAAQIANLRHQASSNSATVRLLALSRQAEAIAGQEEQARKSFDEALTLTIQEADLLQRARLLHTLAQVPGVSQDGRLAPAISDLARAVEDKPAPERADVLAELALLYADVGNREAFGVYRALALGVAGLSAEAVAGVFARLEVKSDLAYARQFQSAGDFLQAEERLRQAALFIL